MYLHDSTQVIPVQSTNPDTYHDSDTWLSNALSGNMEIFGKAVQFFTENVIKGAANALGVSETIIWVGGIAAVLYIVTKKK